MIFITVGSQKFQFNRLLKEIDNLVEKNNLDSTELYAQTGYSTYEPKFFPYQKFLNREQFLTNVSKCEILITHGGTGSIINGVKMKKRVIAVPRLKEYGEHVDNHQIEIIDQFSKAELIYPVTNIKDIEQSINKIKSIHFKNYKSNTNNIINLIEDFLNF